ISTRKRRCTVLRSWTQWLRAKSTTSKSGLKKRRVRLQLEFLEERCLLSGSVGQQIFTVNSAADDPTGTTAGVVTLRDAILAVNSDVNDSNSNPDVINFAISGA